MTFRIRGLDPLPFRALFGMSDEKLAPRRTIRRIADEMPGFPCRVSLEDAQPGAIVLLTHFEHLPVETPYRSSHAIYVSDSFERFDESGVVPQALRDRLLALRAFDARGMMVDADIVEGTRLEPLIERFFGLGEVAYLHAHFARRGCFAARIDRN